MPLSPVCLVSVNSGPFVPTTNGVNVPPGANVQMMLQNPTGVGLWFMIIYGTDELTTSLPSLSNVNPGNGQVTSPTAIVSFTYPGTPAGRSIVFQSTVSSGSNTAQTTFGIYSLTPNGDRVGAVGETREGNVSYGWAALLNPIMRQGAGYLYYNDGLATPPTGSSTIQGAIDYLKSHGGSGNGTDVGAIHALSYSNGGPGGSQFFSGINTQNGSVVVASGGNLKVGGLFDPTGPYVWGISGPSIFRYYGGTPPFFFGEGVVFVPLSDLADNEAFPAAIAQDGAGNIWTIEGASGSLVKIGETSPKILAVYPIPGSSKLYLAYDPTTNSLILADTTHNVASFSLTTTTFGPDTALAIGGTEGIKGLFTAGGFLFVAAWNTTGLSGYIHNVSPSTFSIIGSVTLTVGGSTQVIPDGFAYLQNGSTPKFLTTLNVFPHPPAGTLLYQIDVNTMTVDTSVNILGASVYLPSLAFNPNDNSLWIADAQYQPSRVYVVTGIPAGPLVYSATHNADPSEFSAAYGVFWNTDANNFFVTCGDGVTSVSVLTTSGNVTSTNEIADSSFILSPGSTGQVLTSQGPGTPPIWAAASGGTPAPIDKTANFTVGGGGSESSGTEYRVDCTGGRIIATLPASPNDGDRYTFVDPNGRWAANPPGSSQNFEIATTNFAYVQFVGNGYSTSYFVGPFTVPVYGTTAFTLQFDANQGASDGQWILVDYVAAPVANGTLGLSSSVGPIPYTLRVQGAVGQNFFPEQTLAIDTTGGPAFDLLIGGVAVAGYKLNLYDPTSSWGTFPVILDMAGYSGTIQDPASGNLASTFTLSHSGTNITIEFTAANYWIVTNYTYPGQGTGTDNGRALRNQKYLLQRANTSGNSNNSQGDAVWGAYAGDGIFQTNYQDRFSPSRQSAGADISILGDLAYLGGMSQNISLSGNGASITTEITPQLAIVTGLTGMQPWFVNQILTLIGSSNNGSWFIAEYLSPTSVVIIRPTGSFHVPDDSNPDIRWTFPLAPTNGAPSIAVFALGTGRLIASYPVADGTNLPNSLIGFKQVLNESENVGASDAIFYVTDACVATVIFGPWNYSGTLQLRFTNNVTYNASSIGPANTWPGARGILILGNNAESSLKEGGQAPYYSSIGVWTDPTNNQIWAADVLNEGIGAVVGYVSFGSSPHAICLDKETENFWVVFEGAGTINRMSVNQTWVTQTGESGSTGSFLSPVSSGVIQFTDTVGGPWSPSDVGNWLVITQAGTPANNGTFQIVNYTSATQVGIANPNGVSPDSANGSIQWTEYPAQPLGMTVLSSFAVPVTATNIDDIVFDGEYLWGIDRTNSTYYKWSTAGQIVTSYTLSNDSVGASMTSDARIYSDGVYIYIGGLTDESPVVMIHPGTGLPAEYFILPSQGYGLVRGIAFQYGTGDVYLGSNLGGGNAGFIRLTWQPPGTDFGTLDSIIQTPNIPTWGSGTRLGARIVEYTQYPGATTFTLSSTPMDGTRIRFVDLDGNASSFPLTITTPAGSGAGGAPINGKLQYVLADDYGFVELLFDGGVWIILSRSSTVGRQTWQLLAGPPAASAVGASTPQIVGTVLFDPAYPSLGAQTFFRFVLYTTNASNVATIDLIDVNNILGNGAGVEVPGSLSTTIVTTPTYASVEIAALENYTLLSTTPGIFQVRIWLAPQAAGQQVICGMAKLDVEYS